MSKVIKSFFQWAEDNKLDLPVFTDVETAQKTDVEEPADATGENTRRTGLSQNYPDAYVRNQYPHKYFNPTLATTDYYMQAKAKKVPDNVP